MAGTQREYRRLPGGGIKRGSFFAFTAIRSNLWAGSDHLLLVSSTGFTEEYRRFYYRDIQAFLVRKTGRGAAWSFISAAVLALLALLAFTRAPISRDGFFWFWTLFLGIPFLIVLLVNLLKGPTCVCHIQTAVSREELPSLARMRTARKALAIVRPLIEAAQGRLTREEIASRSEALLRQPGQEGAPAAGARGPAAANGYGGAVHEVLAYVLIIDGLMSGVSYFVRSITVGILGSVLSLVVAVTIVAALAKQHGSGLGKGLRGVTWASFTYMIVLFFLSYIIVILEFIRDPAAAGKGQWEMIKIVSQASPADNIALMIAIVFSVVCATSLGTAGLVLIRKFRSGSGAATVRSGS